MKINKVILGIIIILLLILISFYYQNYYMGNYIIQDTWIASSGYGSNKTICNECLFIKFSEGCNRYSTYYFENEHILNPRLNVGYIVNIRFKEVNGKYYIKNIDNAKKYRSKC